MNQIRCSLCLLALLLGTLATFSAPAIAVLGNNVSITNGAVSPNTANYTDFGSVNTNTTLTRTFIITNSGNASLAIGAIAASGANPGDFLVFQAPASSVDSSNSTTFQIRFKPTAIGLRTATLAFTNNVAGKTPFKFSIQGTGVDSGGIAPQIAVLAAGTKLANPASYTSSPFLNYGDDVFGNFQGIYHDFIVTNTGTTDLVLYGIGAISGNTGDFSLNSIYNTIIAPGGSTIVTIGFYPLALGLRTATWEIASSDSSNSSFKLNLAGSGVLPVIGITGNGVPIAVGEASPSVTDGTDFGSTPTTGGIVVHSFVITNSSPYNLQLNGGTVFGNGGNDFSISDRLTNVVAPHGSKSFQVTFNPSVSGLRTALIRVLNNDPNRGAFEFNVQGTGTNSAPTVANPIPNQAVTQNTPFTFTFAANTFAAVDPGTVLTYTATNLPAWLTFTPSTRTFAGTPDTADVGTVPITVLATGNGLKTGDTFQLTVKAVPPPVIVPQNLLFLANGAFQFTFTNTNAAVFRVVASTNLMLPITNWAGLGTTTNLGNSHYRFTDTNALIAPRRYYRLVYP